MQRFLNRPIFTLATFIFLLVKSYFTVIDNYAAHLPIFSERDSIMTQLQNLQDIGEISETQTESDIPILPANPIVSTEIGLGYSLFIFFLWMFNSIN